jgi:hypothetical protein
MPMTPEQRTRNIKALEELREMRASLVGMVKLGVMLASPRIGSTAREVLPQLNQQIEQYERALAK